MGLILKLFLNIFSDLEPSECAIVLSVEFIFFLRLEFFSLLFGCKGSVDCRFNDCALDDFQVLRSLLFESER